jgi:FHA domain
MIKCSECGYENTDGLDYCDGCGAKLNASAGQTEGAPESSSAAAPATSTEVQAAPAEATPAEAQPGTEAASTAGAGASASAEAASEAPTGEIHPAEAAQAAAAAPQAAGAPFKAKLSIIRGGRRGQEFELEAGKNFIGRWDPETGAFPEVDLDADDPEAKVSRKHALIIIEGSKITLEDIGSLNGTYVNRGTRLIPGSLVELKTGDEIIIGKTFLKLAIEPIS